MDRIGSAHDLNLFYDKIIVRPISPFLNHIQRVV